jgi:hypothetical protein
MQNVLSTIEKCSVKRQAQDVMLMQGIVEWIARVLRGANKLREYTLEYVTALLMNLALRSEGKRRCEDPRLELLIILKPLLDRDNLRIKTHINGTLYSLFACPSLKQEAKVLALVQE